VQPVEYVCKQISPSLPRAISFIPQPVALEGAVVAERYGETVDAYPVHDCSKGEQRLAQLLLVQLFATACTKGFKVVVHETSKRDSCLDVVGRFEWTPAKLSREVAAEPAATM
jgi:hypothetical protein